MNQSEEEVSQNNNVHPMVKKIEKARKDAREARDNEEYNNDDDRMVGVNDVDVRYGG